MISTSKLSAHRPDRPVTRLAQQPGRGLRPWLNRLLASKRGNVLPIFAASILPMAAMIGGAIDMSRAYMVKSRVQQACDAGVLAGRRAMQQSNYTAEAKAQAQNFFNINFQEGYNQSKGVVFNTSNPAGTSKVLGTASTTMPTTIMGIFGKETINVEVTCEAELNLSNSDVTFVLDVTGSMSQSIPNGSGGSVVKLTSLRSAVMSFYDTLAGAATGSNARVRYAFVPYSTNVNVGKLLFDTNPQWLRGANINDTWSYQSRRAVWNVTNTTTAEHCEIFGADFTPCPTRPHSGYSRAINLSPSNCTKFGNNEYFLGFVPPLPGNPHVKINGNTKETFTYTPWSWGGAASNWNEWWLSKQCLRRRVTETTTTTQSVNWQPGATFAYWEYLQRSYPIYHYLRSMDPDNPAVALPTDIYGGPSRWAGCIEERKTVPGANIAYSGASGITVDGTTNALDLNIDAVPTNTDSKWKPYWQEVYYMRDGYQDGACPAKAQLLQSMTRDQVNTYVNSLVAVGGTYHDVGLLWGARIASPQGIFQSNVNASPGNGGSVGRHVIFMTDGELTSYDYVASMYGLERLDQRVTGGSNSPTQLERQRRRYLAICEAIKGKGIRLWVIAFGTTLTDDLKTCSSSGSSFTAENSAKLNTAFQNIAKQISELRLTK